MRITKNDVLFAISLSLSLWFAGTGYIWTYGVAIIIAYPFGITSYLIWRYIKKDGKKRNKIIPIVIIAGLLLSLIALWLTR
jgi:NADH:ubiquinone oxidoreductase subunit 6 (subunit J)